MEVRVPVEEISFEDAWDRVCIELNKHDELSWFIDSTGKYRRIHDLVGFSHTSNIKNKFWR